LLNLNCAIASKVQAGELAFSKRLSVLRFWSRFGFKPVRLNSLRSASFIFSLLQGTSTARDFKRKPNRSECIKTHFKTNEFLEATMKNPLNGKKFRETSRVKEQAKFSRLIARSCRDLSRLLFLKWLNS
jgi:hypothetical protein